MSDMNSNESTKPVIIPTGEATGILPCRNNEGSPITVIGTKAIRDSIEATCLEQALNARSSPGVTRLIVNPDAHQGYGAPIGCVLVSPTHIYPGPVGVDIKCSMSLLQLDLPVEEIADKRIRRNLINAITERTPTGTGQGQRNVKKSRKISYEHAVKSVTEGASVEVCEALQIPVSWAQRCEDAFHRAHDGSVDSLSARFDKIKKLNVFHNMKEKLMQLGSYGGGNHFGECEAVSIEDPEVNKSTADVFGLKNGSVAFLSHCGSRGFGNILATNQFKELLEHFRKWNIPLPANDRHLVYAPLGSPEANEYLDDMALGANFATVNHLLINALILEAFQEVIPGVTGHLVYFISHNIARKELFDNKICWVHRKGATRAFPADHYALKGTPFEHTGHPILLPGNPVSGSVVMVAEKGAELSCYSVNHGAGRQLGRKAAFRELNQWIIDKEFRDADILTNCRTYPKDEAPSAYKDFDEVVRSVKSAGLTRTVARLKARFVIKDSSGADD
ncbi:MAG TPA: RtcB family protein [Chitinispirillaceae bacterium]|nr:RtcB family protein [Chitinispirillaceae bacterium]